jgi:dynein light intermediate chain 1
VLLRSITSDLETPAKEAMAEVMKEWQQRKRGISVYDSGGPGTGSDGNVTLPLSQGEWDEPLGMPLCVVCHNVCLRGTATWT